MRVPCPSCPWALTRPAWQSPLGSALRRWGGGARPRGVLVMLRCPAELCGHLPAACGACHGSTGMLIRLRRLGLAPTHTATHGCQPYAVLRPPGARPAPRASRLLPFCLLLPLSVPLLRSSPRPAPLPKHAPRAPLPGGRCRCGCTHSGLWELGRPWDKGTGRLRPSGSQGHPTNSQGHRTEWGCCQDRCPAPVGVRGRGDAGSR